jgi:hypothetical protein
VSLTADLERTAAAATALAPDGASLTAVLAAEPAIGVRGYLCAFGALTARALGRADDRGENHHRQREPPTSSLPPAIAEEPASAAIWTSLLASRRARLTESPRDRRGGGQCGRCNARSSRCTSPHRRGLRRPRGDARLDSRSTRSRPRRSRRP